MDTSQNGSTMPPRACSDPESTLRAFIAAMHEWETETFRIVRQTDNEGNRLPYDAPEIQAISAKLDTIFATFCTPRKRKQGRQNCMATSSPPDYDPATEKITGTHMEKPRRSLIFTKDTRPFGKEHCYVLLRRDDRWLIDSKKIKYIDGWEQYFL